MVPVRDGSRLAVPLVVALVCLAAGAVPAVAVTDPTPTSTLTADGTATGPGSSDGETVTLRHEFRLTPGDPGNVTVRLRFGIPESVVRLEAILPSSATVTRTDGFADDGGGVYTWDGGTTPATITYRLAVNETRQAVGPEGGRGRYVFVDAGQWALFRRPQVGVRATARGSVSLDQERTTRGPGVVGDSIVYLGPSETHRRRAHGQTFRLVVPDRANLAESPDAVLDSLATAADQLRVGDRDETVDVFVAPTTAVEWGVHGLHVGDANMWVRDAERLSTAENTWLHEYVHSRQEFRTTGRTAWTTEATATYYAALLTLQQDRIGFEAFRDSLRAGARQPQTGSVLAEPSTWRNAAQYRKGMLVVGDTDRRLRLASGGTRSFQTVLSGMNAADGRLDEETLMGLIGDASNRTVRRAAERFTTTDRTPEVWGAAAHAEAFGTAPALISIGFAEDSLAVSGPYRNTTIPSPTVYTNETLTVRATLENAGGETGEATGVFTVDGREVATERATLDPGESRTVEFSYTFGVAGEHTVAFGDDEMTITVDRPARASVTASSVNRTRLPEPGTVELAATVDNTESVPAERTVTVRRDGEGVARRTVTLGPGERRVVTVTVRLPQPGEYALQAGGDTITVTVADPTAPTDREPAAPVEGTDTGGDAPPADGAETALTADGSPAVTDGGAVGTVTGSRTDADAGGPSSGFGPGPGVPAALLAVLLALAALRRRE